MNRFGREALRVWQELAPTEVAEMASPETFFAQLGQEAEDAWVDLSVELAGSDRPGETYWQKVGRLTNARLRAEEIIRHEWLRPPSATTAEEEPDDLADETPDPLGVGELWALMEAEREAEYEREAETRHRRDDNLR